MSASASRRQFLAALPALPLAAAAPAAAAPPRRRFAHDPEKAARSRCDCDRPDCAAARVALGRHPLHVAAVLALRRLDAALARLQSVPPEDDPWGVWYDADGCRFAIGYGVAALEGELIEPDGFEALVRRAALPGSLPAHEAAVVALYDARDALLDMTAGHCAEWDCNPCTDADGLLYAVRSALDLIGGALRTTPAVARRALLSAERAARRARENEAEGGCFMPHTEREHGSDPDHDVAHARRMLRAVSDR